MRHLIRHALLILSIPLILLAALVAISAFMASSMMGPEDWEGFKTCHGEGRHWDSLANYCEGPD
jgi:hypothetical protein